MRGRPSRCAPTLRGRRRRSRRRDRAPSRRSLRRGAWPRSPCRCRRLIRLRALSWDEYDLSCRLTRFDEPMGFCGVVQRELCADDRTHGAGFPETEDVLGGTLDAVGIATDEAAEVEAVHSDVAADEPGGIHL